MLDWAHNWKISFTLFRMGLFGVGHGWVGPKRPYFLKSVTNPAIMKLGTVIHYLKKIKKISESRDTLLDFCWDQHFFDRKSVTFFISRNTDIDWILIHNFKLFQPVWVFKGCFNKCGCNIDNVSKIGSRRPS